MSYPRLDLLLQKPFSARYFCCNKCSETHLLSFLATLYSLAFIHVSVYITKLYFSNLHQNICRTNARAQSLNWLREGRKKTDKRHHGRNKQTLDKNQVKMYPYNPITELPQSNKGHRLGNLILTVSLSFSLSASNVTIDDHCNRNAHHVGSSDHKLVLITLNQTYPNRHLAC